MKLRLLAIAALVAVTSIAATAGSAVAANATLNRDADVYARPNNSSAIVNEVFEDDDVTVRRCSGNYCLLRIAGPDGWVRTRALDMWDEDDEDDGPPRAQVCVGVPMGGGICLNN